MADQNHLRLFETRLIFDALIRRKPFDGHGLFEDHFGRGKLRIQRQHQALHTHTALAKDFDYDLFKELKGEMLAEKHVGQLVANARHAQIPNLRRLLAERIAQAFLLLGFNGHFLGAGFESLGANNISQKELAAHHSPHARRKDGVLGQGEGQAEQTVGGGGNKSHG